MADAGIVFAINSLATLIVVGVVYITGRKRLQSSIWLVYNVLFSAWNFCMYKAVIQSDATIALYWFRASFIPLIFLTPVFLHFLSIYSEKEVFRNRIIKNIYVTFFLIFVAYFIIPGEFIRGVSVGSAGPAYGVRPGGAFLIFVLVFVGFVCCGLYYLGRHAKKAYLVFRRNQRIWIFFGMFLSVLSPVHFFLSAYGIRFFSMGLFMVLPYLAITGYAIVKYHVPEVNIVFKKATLLSYSSLFIILSYSFAVFLLHRIVGMEYFESSIIAGSIILINILLTAHYGGMLRFNKMAENIVFKNRLAYYKFLETFNAMMKEERDINSILGYVLDSMKDLIGIRCVMLYMSDEETSSFKLTVSRGVDRKLAKEARSVSAASPLIDFLKEGNIYVAGETADFDEYYNLEEVKKVFDKVNVKMTMPLLYSVPLYQGRDVIAFLTLGEKKDKTAYSEEDVDILNAFGRELSICLDKAKIFMQVITDELTKLYRHGYFYKRLEEEIERSGRYGRTFSLIFVDVDDFKKINDVFGHRVGDEVLRRVAGTISSHLRKVDIAARYGGEEFAILLPETDRANAPVVGERIRKLVEEDFLKRETRMQVLKQAFADGVRLKVTVSVGISSYRPGGEVDTLVKEADKALYRAKWEGKNKVFSSE